MMHKKDFVKQVLSEYIGKGHDFYELTPSHLATLKELKGYSERTLKRGRTEFKNENSDLVSRHSKSSANLKKRIFQHLDNNPDTTPKKLRQAFPKIDNKELAKARKTWKERQETILTKKSRKASPSANIRQKKKSAIRPKSAKGKVMNYMIENPDATVNDVKNALPEINPSSVNTYYSLLKKARKEKTLSGKTGVSGIRGAAARSGASNAAKDDIIRALKETVEAQNKAIEALQSQNALLQKKQTFIFPELEGMGKKDVEKVETVIQTFIRGLKRR